MKKALFILPMFAFLLAGCGGGGNSNGGGGDQTPQTVLKLDFSTAPAGNEITSAAATTKLMSFKTEGAATATVQEIVKVFEGNGSGGAKPNAAGLLKMGTGSVNGKLSLQLSASFTKVIVNCHSFYASGEQYPTNTTNFVKVNGGTAVAFPYNAEATGENLEFTVSGSTFTLETHNPAPAGTATAGRGVLYSITFIA